MSEAQRAATPEVDFRPFIIADADTGHGGDAHVRNLVRRFVEVGVPGYHIEDQKPGVKKCGHQGGKVLVAEDEQIKRLNAARFQLDVMKVPGIIVARTDAESATFLDGRGDERDQPFILGATNVELPTYKVGYLAILRRLRELGVDDMRGHLLFKISDAEYDEANAWLARTGVMRVIEENAKACGRREGIGPRAAARQGRDPLPGGVAGRGQPQDLPRGGGRRDRVPQQRGRALRHERRASGWPSPTARRSTPPGPRPRSMGINIIWDCEISQDARGLLPGPGRHRLRDRQVAGRRALRRSSCGWRPRPRIWRMPSASPTRSTPSSPTRCWPTTCRRRSTGTPPG